MSSSKPSSIAPSRSPPRPQAASASRSPPQPHFDDPPQHEPPGQEVSNAEADDDEEDELPYPEPISEEALLPPPNFNPFFTLIEDTTSGDHHHPYVHYVFADDDPVIVTAAAMRSLGLDDAQYLPQNIPEGDHERLQQEEGDQEHDSLHQAESPLPPPIPGVKERYIIVDVGADGHTVVDTQSLSPEWQITSANVRTAPSFDQESSDHTYMLQIEGVEVPRRGKGKIKGDPGESKLKQAMDGAQGDAFAAMDGLVQGVERSLEIAGKIMGRGPEEESQTVVAAGPEEESKTESKGKGKAKATGTDND